MNAYVDIEKHFGSVGTVEIFDFPTRPPPRVLDIIMSPAPRWLVWLGKPIGEFLT